MVMQVKYWAHDNHFLGFYWTLLLYPAGQLDITELTQRNLQTFMEVKFTKSFRASQFCWDYLRSKSSEQIHVHGLFARDWDHDCLRHWSRQHLL